LQDVDRVDPYLATEIHNRSFQNPSEFSVILTGNIQKEEAVPLLLKYL
jgi:hypothetical protein